LLEPVQNLFCPPGKASAIGVYNSFDSIGKIAGKFEKYAYKLKGISERL
jgi:hypothetical protein